MMIGDMSIMGGLGARGSMLAICVCLLAVAASARHDYTNILGHGDYSHYHRRLTSSDGENDEKWFSVPAFFVVFRETIEAVVIIAVLLRFLDKIGKPQLKTSVWRGAFAGLAGAIVLGVGFIIAFYTAKENFFAGDTEKIFEGFLMVFASIIITVLAVSMLKISHMREKWERKLAKGMQEAEARGAGLRPSYMFWLPFTAVLREGIETVIFLAGVGASYPARSIPIPGVLGLIVGLVCGYTLFRVGNEASLKTFLTCSTVLLLFIAAGLFAHGMHEFQEVGWFGTYYGSSASASHEGGASDSADPNWANTVAWSICSCCPNDGDFWGLVRALVGYTCAPTNLEILAWCMYWVFAITVICFKLRLLCFKNYKSKNDFLDEEEGDGVKKAAGDVEDGSAQQLAAAAEESKVAATAPVAVDVY